MDMLVFSGVAGFQKGDNSMSTSMLYHGWGIRGYQYVRSEFGNGQIVYVIRQEGWRLRCPACGSSWVICRGQFEREFRTLPIGRKPVIIRLPIQRVGCQHCGVVRQVKVGFADPRRSYTHCFERYAVALCRMMTIAEVAKHLGVSWDVIKDIHKRYLHRRFAKPRLKHLRRIAIDEISVGHGQRYLTVVLDLDSGAVVFVGKGRSAETLEPFWRRLRASSAKVRAVAIDMSPAYINAVRRNLPKAKIVFDRFHVVKLFNDKLSDLRRQVQSGAEGLAKKVLKCTRWLLLMNPENLDEERNETQRLEEALRLNKPLATAYYLKEDLREFWEQPDKATARRFLKDWIAQATASGIQMLIKFARTLQIHEFGLLAWYDFPISTGPLEGTNNKIKTLQRRAYGYRDQEYFTLRIYGLHETKYALVG
jgi:transposase